MKRDKSEKINIKHAYVLYVKSLKRMWGFDKKFVIFSIIVLTLGTLPDLFISFAVAIFNNRIIIGAKEYTHYYSVYTPLICAIILILVDMIMYSLWKWAEMKTVDSITSVLLRESVKKASQIDFKLYDDPEYYDCLQKGWLQDGRFFVNSATTFISSISYLLGVAIYISALTYVDWKLMVCITTIRVAVNPLINKQYEWIYKINNDLAEKRRKEQYYHDFFNNKLKTSEGRIYNLINHAIINYENSHRMIYKSTFIHKIKIGFINLLSNVIYSLPLSLSYIYLSICVFHGTIELGEMTLFVSIYMGFIDHIYNAINKISGFRYYSEQSRYAREFLDIPTEIFSLNDSQKRKMSNKSIGHKIEFRNVSFCYPGTDRFVLKNINFTINEKETVSIIGNNGAGKTTLINLLIRLYDPTEGDIYVDDVNLKEYSVEDLYNNISVLFQDYCDFPFSAKEAISASTKDISMERMNYSLTASTANRFINKWILGLDTPLSRKFDENGVEPSIGQLQRISLAKAYYKDASIIVLDEPSASIDPEAEIDIFKEIQKLHGQKNICIITHRLASCLFSDKILFLKEGKLIAYGNHTELFKNCSEYKDLYITQSNKYIDVLD